MGTASSVGATFMSPACVRCCVACAPSCLVGVCLTAPVPGVINGAPTGYAAVRSWCPVVFSFVHVGTAVSVGATFMSPACVRCCAVGRAARPVRGVCAARVRAVVSRRCMSYRFCTGRHKWRPYRACHRAVVVSRRFFIRACGNRRQRRGDIHVARERALLRCWAGGMSGPWRLCRPRACRRVLTVFVLPLLYRAS